MAGTAYAGTEDYAALFPEEDAPDEAALAAASRQIDAAAYGRIRALGGLDGLTELQRELVREAVCRQAKFRRENESLFTCAMSSYAINGVSMKMGSAVGTAVRGGVPIAGEAASLLDMTGLTDRTLREAAV